MTSLTCRDSDWETVLWASLQKLEHIIFSKIWETIKFTQQVKTYSFKRIIPSELPPRLCCPLLFNENACLFFKYNFLANLWYIIRHITEWCTQYNYHSFIYFLENLLSCNKKITRNYWFHSGMVLPYVLKLILNEWFNFLYFLLLWMYLTYIFIQYIVIKVSSHSNSPSSSQPAPPIWIHSLSVSP